MGLRTVRALIVAALSVSLAQAGLAAPAAQAEPAPAAVSETAVSAAAVPDTTNPVVLENRKPGSSAWRIPAAGKQIGADTTSPIKGFMSATSINVGESIDLKVSVASAGDFEYSVFRMGWYQGHGGRLITKGTAPGIKQPACQTNTSTGMLTCPWEKTLTFDTTEEWMSGIYLIVLTKGQYQNWAQFVVRDDAQQGAVVAMLPINTMQAYNSYPEGAGKSLYEFNSSGAKTVAGTTRAVKVSFDRPYAWSGVSHKIWEPVWTGAYLESRGWPVKYVTNADLDRDPSIALGQVSMLSVGHDEYWTGAMYTAAEQARDAGVDLSFLGGNSVFWQVRYEPSAAGVDRRVVVSYKNAAIDPVTTLADETILFRNAGRPEQRLVGVQYDDPHGETRANAAWVVQNPSHWAYRGTGLVAGSRLANLVGGEVDKYMSNFPAPSASSRTLLARSPFVDVHGHSGYAESWMYKAPSGANVFSAGTWRINQALGGVSGYDNPWIRTVMGNVIARASEFELSADFARDGGSDRYETAVLVSRRHFETTGGTVVIATGSDFPDALSATPVTRGEGPILLVKANEVPAVVRAELTRLAPSKVIIAGSAAVVSDAVAADIAALTGASVERRGGADRYETAAKLSQAAFAPGVPVAYVATGLNFPDALAAGSAGAALGGPVLLNKGDTLQSATLAELQRLQPKRIVVAGSAAVVSESVLTQLRSLAPEVVRLAGQDRYETSRAITRDLRGPSEARTAYLATGVDFPDALAAAPAVASSGGVLVLVSNVLGAGAAEEIVRNRVSQVIAVGSAAVVSNTVISQAKALFDVVDGAGARMAPAPTEGAAPPPEAPTTTEPAPVSPEQTEPKTDTSHDPVWMLPRDVG
jgi:putative cell wall-binding protein